MNWFKLLCCFTSLPPILAATSKPYSNDLVVDLDYARFQGVQNATVGVNIWFGLRYAAPPTGDLRWQPPKPIEQGNAHSSNAIVDATSEGPICVHGFPAWRLTNTTVLPIGSEDCLLLDVVTPTNPVSSKLPVMVQIHGGGYAQGGSEFYPGWALVNASNGNMIYVTMQYRLSAYGFLGSADVRSNGTANAGLLDQRTALHWIQRHIGSFGGDPNKVTIIGGSAGGGSVTAHMTMYGGESSPPFRAGIAEYPWWQSYHSDRVLEEQYRDLLEAANCGSLQCLRSMGADELALAQEQSLIIGYDKKHYGWGDFWYGPSVDGTIIRDLPSNEFRNGHFTKGIPLMTNRDSYEGYNYRNKNHTTFAEMQADFQALFPAALPSFFARLWELYPASDYNSTFFRSAGAFGDFIIDCPTYYIASAVSDVAPVWKMVFDAGTQLHGADKDFLFNTTFGTQPGQNLTIANVMKDWYLSFVVEGDPNARTFIGDPKPVTWAMYMNGFNGDDGKGFNIMSINYTEIGMVRDPDASAKCDWWHGQSAIVRN
jgi:carboxylesterase type B